MRADRRLDGVGDDLRDRCDGGGEICGGAVRTPVEDEVRRVRIRSGECLLPSGRTDRGGGDEDARPLASFAGGALERHALDDGEALVVRRRLELAEARICRVGASTPGSERAAASSSSGVGERAEPIEEALDEVDLRLGERRVEPDAACGDPVARRGLDDVAARGACEVGVVEHDLARASGECLLERAARSRNEPPRSSRLSRRYPRATRSAAMQRLAGSRDAHHEHDVARLPRDPARLGRAEPRSLAVVELQRGCARGRPRGLRSAGAGDRDDVRREVEDPRERDLGFRHAALAGDRGRTARGGEALARDAARRAASAPSA